jgi:tetratricopeptide (TPR) repeat protein
VNRTQLVCAVLLLLPIACFRSSKFKQADEAAQRGWEHLDRKEYDAAITDFDEAIRLNPNFATAYNNRGFAYARKGNLEQALTDYNEAIRLDPNQANFYSNRGDAYRAKGEDRQAIADYDAALKLNPSLDVVLHNRGSARLAVGQYDQAAADFSEAIRLAPNDARAHYQRGVAHRALKAYDRSAADYAEALRLAPEDVNLLTDYAWLLATCPQDAIRNGPRAVELARKACELSEWKSFRALTALAAAHAECRDFKEAIRRQKQALDGTSHSPGDESTGRHLLKLYEEGSPNRDG